MGIHDQQISPTAVMASKQELTTREVSWIAIMAFLIPVVIIQYLILRSTNGTFSYPVDDAYIHLAIAKNLAFHQVWGISSHEFVSASSSLLYPLLLSLCIKLFGTHIIIPFIINILTSIAFIIVLHRWLIRQDLQPMTQLLILLVTILAIPLPVIAMSGMEHSLQILFCFLFISRFSDEVSKLHFFTSEQNNTNLNINPNWTLSWPVYLYGILITMTRYESLAIIAIACLILLFHRKVRIALLLGFISTLPNILFGTYSILHGNHFFPNSVLLKSSAPRLTKQGLLSFFSQGLFDQLSLTQGVYTLAASQRMFILLFLTYLIFEKKMNTAKQYKYLFIFLSLTTFAQLAIGSSNLFPRYEAYLIAGSTILLSVVFVRYGRDILFTTSNKIRWVAIFTILVLVIPIIMRIKSAFYLSYIASVNVYDQQYQMAQFMDKYYHDAAIAFHDIGAVSYFTEGPKLDLWGLGSVQIANAFMNKTSNNQLFQHLILRDSISIAIVFDQALPPSFRSGWSKIASWKIPNNIICAYDNVTFYATNKADSATLRKNLLAFEQSLPNEVQVRYY